MNLSILNNPNLQSLTIKKIEAHGKISVAIPYQIIL